MLGSNPSADSVASTDVGGCCGIPLSSGAPGRAHSLGGVSPLHTRQGEVLAERQGCPS
jgi:hypothetical protein